MHRYHTDSYRYVLLPYENPRVAYSEILKLATIYIVYHSCSAVVGNPKLVYEYYFKDMITGSIMFVMSVHVHNIGLTYKPYLYRSGQIY